MTALLLAASASAAAIVLGTGLETSFNDPFVTTVGTRVSGSIELAPWVRVGASGGLYPHLGVTRLTRLTTNLSSEVQIMPDISDIRWRGMGRVAITPLRQSDGVRSRVFGGYAEAGLIHTVDDLDAIQGVGDPIAEDTAKQLHPTVAYGIIGEVWWSERWGGRLRMERSLYTEVVMSTVEESRSPSWVGLDVLYRWN